MTKDILQKYTHYIMFILYCFLLTLSKTLEYSLYGFNLSSILFSIHQITLLIFLYSFTKISQRVFVILTFPIFTYEVLSIGHFSIFEIPLTIGGLASFLNSNFGEWIDYLRGISVNVLVVGILFILIPLFLLISPSQKIKFKRPYLYIIPTLIIFLSKYFTLKNVEQTIYFSIEKSRPYQSIALIYDTFIELRKFSNLKNNLVFSDIQMDEVSDNNNSHIVIIGESSRRHNWQLYNYERETTPNLIKKHNDIIHFKDAISASNLTLLSIQESFYFKSPQDPKAIPTNNLINVLNTQGFETYWISNQQKISEIDTPISVIASFSSKSLFINTDLLSKSLDENLLDHLDYSLKSTENKKVIFVHTMGSHGEYEKRYPKSFSIFNDKNTHKDINTYDNSIRYTDFFISKVIDLADKYNIATVTYFSDHGETINEDNVAFPTHGNPNFKKREIEIPFLIWFNPLSSNENKKTIAMKNSSKKYILSNFKYDFLNLLGYSVKGANSIFTEGYKETARYVFGSDYILKDYEKLE